MNVALIESAYEAWNRHDADALVAITHPDVEIAPLVMGAISAGPWHGHDGVRKLVADAQDRWAEFQIECERVLTFGERAVALVHVEVSLRPGGPSVTGDIAHVIEFEDGRARRFTAYRSRAEAVAVVES